MMQLYVYIYMRKHSQHKNDERTHFFRKKYTSHTLFSKELRKGCVWEVSWRLNKDCNILTTSSSIISSISFSFCWAAQPGALRTQPSAESWFSLSRTATNRLQLTEFPVAPDYIIVWCPPASCEYHICNQFNPSTVKVIPWYLRPDAPVPWLTAGSKVNMLQVSKVSNRSRGWPEGSLFNSYYTEVEGRALLLSLDCSTWPLIITLMLCVKQGSIKYHFLSLWYDSTWDWTQVSGTIGEHSNHNANVLKI